MEAHHLPQAWGIPLVGAVCDHCDRRYLLPADSRVDGCPTCFRSSLSSLEEELEHLPYVAPPELFLPFTVSREEVDARLTEFVRGIPFAPVDLSLSRLRQRLQRVYLPEWLVDATAVAHFKADVGFDYEVLSHKEQFRDDQWHTVEIKERRKRWEPRVGRLRRRYGNIPAPALEAEHRWRQRLGEFERGKALPYAPEALQDALVLLPDRAPEDAWSDARVALESQAAEESRLAAAADHVRDFRWSATFHERNWTQLLRPAFTTFYIDDDGKRHPIVIHGQMGRVSGRRRASMKRAQRVALLAGVAAALIFAVSAMLSLGALVAFPPLLAVGAAGLRLSFLVLLGALAPPAIVWFFQRRDDPVWRESENDSGIS